MSADAGPPRSPTAPTRSGSKKALLQREIAALLNETTTSAAWTADGFAPDLDLLGRVLARCDPADVRGGSVATGLDLWTAHMLRVAGLNHVVPRASEPFFVGRSAAAALAEFARVDGAVVGLERAVEQSGSPKELTGPLRTLTSALRSMRKGLEQGTTTVLGEGRRKQVDVFVADWDRGLELLVSTKTFALNADPGELMKNLPNRWEEFDGDLKNLRGRFPLAVIGALAVVPADVVANALPAFVDMLTKITAPGRPWVNAYDRAALIVVEPWVQGSASPVAIRNVTLGPDQVPEELSPTAFFTALLTRLLERAPIAEHREARIKRAIAQGADSAAIEAAARASASAVREDPATYGTGAPR